MPNKDQHINTWKRNRALLQSNACAANPEWVVVIAFYCTLHAVESLFAHKAFPRCKDHISRNEFLAHRNNKLLGIWHPYKTLFDASHDARYTCPDVTRRFPAATLKDLIQSRLQSIEAAVLSEIVAGREEFPLLDVDSVTGLISIRSGLPKS